MRRMISKSKQEVLEEIRIDGGYIVTNSPVKPDEPICLDELSRLKIKFVQAAQSAYTTGTSYGTTVGTVIATGVTSITSDDAHGGAMIYENTPEGTANSGEIKVLSYGGDARFFWNDNGTYKQIDVDLEATWAIIVNSGAVWADEATLTMQGVTLWPAIPGKTDYKALFRWSLGDFQVAKLDSEDGYKTL